MKRILVLTIVVLALALPMVPSASAATCIPTGFYRDGINMTAALINPSAPVTGDVSAAGCNIGVYYDRGNGTVREANVYGANYFGVLVNGDTNQVRVDIKNSRVHNIGEVPFNGAQHGVAIYYRALGTGTATGTIKDNTVSLYQKGGITVNGAGANVEVKDNKVAGLGKIAFIAQNGIQIGYGARAKVSDNKVGGNWYTGGYWTSAGLLLYDTSNIPLKENASRDDQVGLYVYGSNNDAKENKVGISEWGIILWGDGNKTNENEIACISTGIDVYGNNNVVKENEIEGTSKTSQCNIGILLEKDAGVGTGNVLKENEFKNVVQKVVDPAPNTPLASPVRE